MRGYTKQQLEAKGATVAKYVFCENCSLYWHERTFKKHLRPPPTGPDPKEREIAIIHPAWDRFLDFLVETAIKRWEEDQVKIRRGEPVETTPTKRGAKVDWPPPSPDDPELLTVEQAVVRLGVPRDEILAEFAKQPMIPFEFTIPPGPRARRAAARQAMKAATPSAVRDAGVSAQAESLKKHHAALLERRARLDAEIEQAERELDLTEQRPSPSRPRTRKT